MARGVRVGVPRGPRASVLYPCPSGQPVSKPRLYTTMPFPPVIQALLGAVLLSLILWDAFETVLLPRRVGRRLRLTRMFYILSWRLWRGLARRIPNLTRREAMLALFGPLSLLLLLACWASGLVMAFALMIAAVHSGDAAHPYPFTTVLYMSGETFFTLGFGDITPTTSMGRVLAVFEAGMGFAFLGTVVGYLPTLYAAFSQREVEISMLD